MSNHLVTSASFAATIGNWLPGPLLAGGASWWVRALLAVAVGLMTAQVGIWATTIYLHRAMCHRALTLHPVAAMPFRVVLWITTGVQVREWVGVHRRHHAALDTPSDPHSPAQVGFWRVQLGNLGLYRAAVADKATVARYTRDLHDDWLERNVFRLGRSGTVIGAAGLMVLLGPLYGLLAAVVHLSFFIMAAGAVNAVGHTYGVRPDDNSGTNSRWLAWLTAGEGLHNNHHALPTAARLSFTPEQRDPAWPTIALLARLRLARLRLEGGRSELVGVSRRARRS